MYMAGTFHILAAATKAPTIATDDPGVRVEDNIPIQEVDLLSPSNSEDSGGIPHMSNIAPPIMFGPADAPHLRYFPSYFYSKEIPPKLKQFVPAMISKFHTARLKLYQFLWYKPPVGIVGAWTFLRLLERLYGVFSPPPPTSGEEALEDAEGKIRGSMVSLMPSNISPKLSPWGSIGKVFAANMQNQQMQKQKRRRTRRRKARKGRSFALDRGDRSYDNFGGIENVRVRSCQEGLRSALTVVSEMEYPPSDNSANSNANKGSSLFGVKRNSDGENNALNDDGAVEEYTKDMETALAALQLSCPPRGSREYFVEQSAEPLSGLSKYLTPSGNDANPEVSKSNRLSAQSIQEKNVHLLLDHSSKLIELRTLDALLRTLRERHLIVSSRLRRTRDYWKWHANLSGGIFGRLAHALRKKSVAVFPGLMGYDPRNRNQREYELATATWERELEWLGRVERMLLERPAEMEAGDLLAVIDEGKQKETTWWNNFANSGDETDADSKPSMLGSIQLLLQSKNRIWLKQAGVWCKEAREVVKDSLDETISSSFNPINDYKRPDENGKSQNEANMQSLHYESRFLKSWAAYDGNASDTYSWLTVLSLVDYAASPRRAGERRQFQIAGLASQIKRYDFLGIPSSALLLAASNSLHDNIIAPHKQEIVEFIKSIFTAFWGIIEFRFYTPMKDIALDLLNRRPRMVDPFALLNEQTSLDNMLMDLGVGDGTLQTRPAALAAASRMYEQEVAGGAIRGIVRGRVAQLMLIQIQQLKTDLLQAMDQIDNLVDGNRLNVQLVASIPAGLILFYGTRALFLFVSNVRMKDFRLPRDVHSEMSDHLKKVEECLVLSNYQLDASPAIRESSEAQVGRAEACLTPKEMGQLLLLLHTYLNLMDYMSPPFPSKQCDSIHQSVQNLLMQGQMSTSRQLEL
eukprot:CAMPEP_0181134846 /NCGR_PEP_ID=MMETSP1071-20121207/32306_1 /TAXON_ID=35127 /ORGANISM="Thalassiosira sp., Strain NH16" /LENGTH=917 /DNA_ID=CAMNT_0023221393 /DNA_START=223 /DNA_END=2971 /DNA_ORIENTATION=+